MACSLSITLSNAGNHNDLSMRTIRQAPSSAFVNFVSIKLS